MENQTIVLASNNAKKAAEIRAYLPDCKLLSLQEAGFTEDIDEPFESFESNAQHKAQVVHQNTGYTVMADDSGLCVDALGGAPGIYSARYSGKPVDDRRNNEKLLQQLNGITDRRAKFVCVIALVREEKKPEIFRGEMMGTIAEKLIGSEGFGYDPLFIPEGQTLPIAALPKEFKALHSHRAKALQMLQAFLKNEMS